MGLQEQIEETCLTVLPGISKNHASLFALLILRAHEHPLQLYNAQKNLATDVRFAFLKDYYKEAPNLETLIEASREQDFLSALRGWLSDTLLHKTGSVVSFENAQTGDISIDRVTNNINYNSAVNITMNYNTDRREEIWNEPKLSSVLIHPHGLSSRKFINRNHILSHFDALMAGKTRRRVIFITGAAKVGKTALLANLYERTRARRTPVSYVSLRELGEYTSGKLIEAIVFGLKGPDSISRSDIYGTYIELRNRQKESESDQIRSVFLSSLSNYCASRRYVILLDDFEFSLGYQLGDWLVFEFISFVLDAISQFPHFVLVICGTEVPFFADEDFVFKEEIGLFQDETEIEKFLASNNLPLGNGKFLVQLAKTVSLHPNADFLHLLSVLNSAAAMEKQP